MALKLDKNTNYIGVEELLNEVRNLMPVYFERALLDDSNFYPTIRVCLAKLGLKIFPSTEMVLHVKDYKAELPYDFHKLVLAVGCFKSQINYTNPNPQIFEADSVTVKDFAINATGTECVDKCGNDFYIIQRFETYSVTYDNYFDLRVSKDSIPYCSNNCFNSQIKSQNEIKIDGTCIHTNFEEGYVYMQYIQNLETEEGELLIPDFQQIREWIKAACITVAFRKMYYNNDSDVQQRLNFAKQEETSAELNARQFVKMSDFSDFYAMRKALYDRYSKFNSIVYGDPLK